MELMEQSQTSIKFQIKCRHQPMSQSALQKPSLKPQTASNTGVEARGFDMFDVFDSVPLPPFQPLNEPVLL
jgi:hypothetical protein